MKQEVNPVVLMGVIAAAVLLLGFFLWRGLTATASGGASARPVASFKDEH